jgi:hypothetical protein
MILDQMAAAWMEEHWEAPRIAESDHVGLSGVEIDVHNPIIRDAVARHLRPVNPRTLLRIKD